MYRVGARKWTGKEVLIKRSFTDNQGLDMRVVLGYVQEKVN